MLGNMLFWSGFAVSLVIGVLYFRDLGDVSQMLIRVKRKNMVRFIRNEYRLLAIGLGGLVLMTAVHFGLDAGLRGFWLAAILLCAVLYGFPYIWVHVGLRNQKDSASYYSIEEAKEYVSPSSQVIVIENNGIARAHPQAQLMRPHLAGNDEGLDGENVVMTYCAMANLGIGYTPEVEGQQLDLEVVAQHGNNLILRDNRTGEPIQQIYGFREADATQETDGASLRAPSLTCHATLADISDDLPRLPEGLSRGHCLREQATVEPDSLSVRPGARDGVLVLH